MTTPSLSPEAVEAPTSELLEAEFLGDFAQIRCSCGFAVVGEDEYRNQMALEEHPCPHRPEEYTPWWGFIFSFWGWAIVATIAYVVAAILHAKQW